MRTQHVDLWYHESQFDQENGVPYEDAIPTATENIPDIEYLERVEMDGKEVYGKCPDTIEYYPSVDYGRVNGHTFTPYKIGSDLWRDAANAVLKAEAQSNFQRI